MADSSNAAYVLMNDVIQGESTLKGFEKGVDVVAAGWSAVMNTGTPGQMRGGQRASGTLELKPFSVYFHTGKATVGAIRAIAASKDVGTVTLNQVKVVDGEVQKFSTLKLSNPVVSSVGTLPPGHAVYATLQVPYDALAPLVELTFSITKLEMEYTEYDQQNRKSGTTAAAVGSDA